MKKLHPLAMAVSLALSALVHADDSSFHLSGFGTVGVVQTDTDDAQYRGNLRQPDGADKSASFDVDSKLGVQASGKLGSRFSLTGQVLVQPDEEGDYKPELEWAFAKFDVNNDVAVRAGRIGAPVFLISDFRNVGYANVWARPPVDVYAQVPLSTFDGVDVIWRSAIGDNTLTVQPFVGSTDFDLPNSLEGKAKKFVGLNATYEIGSLLLRAGYTQTDLTLGSAATRNVFSILRANGFASAANALEAEDKKTTFSGLGATWDDGSLFVQGEYTQRRSESWIQDTNGWYLTGGYRFGDFMPYVSYASVETESDAVLDTTIANLPGALAAVQAGIVGLVNRAAADQSTTSVGVRWNAYKNIALKLQYDRVETEAGKGNWFVNSTTTFAGSSVNVYSLVADFVF